MASEEKENFTRLSRLLVEIGTKALRNTLDERYPPTDLPTVLNARKTRLRNLMVKPRVINVTQWDLLFPPSGSPPDSKTFDVTLLTVLLRNLPPLLPDPATGWDTIPPDTDNSLGANITRIKMYRNQVYAHVTSAQVEKATFDHLWQKISKALVDLNVPQNEIDDLKTCHLSTKEEMYEQSLKEWVLNDEECKNMLDGLTRNANLTHNQLMEQTADIQSMQENIHQGIQQQECKLENLTREIMEQKADSPSMRESIKQIHQGIQQQECKLENLTREIMEQKADSPSMRESIKQIHQRIQQQECKLENLTREIMEQKADSPSMREYIEQIPQGIQPQRASSTSRESELLQKLAKHNFTSKIKRKVTSFHLGTREWLLQKIYNWFEDEDESRLLLLTAGPGFGKSVFAAKVCEIFEKKQRLAACHFCDFRDSNLKDPRMMLQSLASHMCQNIVGFKEKLLDQLKRPHEVRSLKDAFQIYLQNPLDELEIERFLIVIDGLDESATDDKSDMAKLIADNFLDLPGCVKVLVTSRPELSVQRLDHIEVINIGVDNKDNESDIRNYLNSCLPTLAARDLTKAIVEKCEGSFLYAFHVQHELRKSEDLDTMTSENVMAFLPKGMGSIYATYFCRLEDELERIMKSKPDLFKLLELLVAVKTELPLNFIARAFDLPLDCRETKKVINKVNEEISCLLYVSGDLVTVFHKSVYDWLLGNGYDNHEYIVKVSDGKKRLWLLCEQVFREINGIVRSGNELKLTNDVKHALQYGHKYLFACQIRDSFPWFVDMIIVHVILNVSRQEPDFLLDKFWENVFRNDMAIGDKLRKKISWHLTLFNIKEVVHEIIHDDDDDDDDYGESLFFYLEAVLNDSPDDCFTNDERKIAEKILSRSPRCVKSISVGMKPTLKPLFIYPKPMSFNIKTVGVAVSSSKKLAAIASIGGTICVLSLPELIEVRQYSTGYNYIVSCTFSPDDTLILYGKLETVLNIREVKEEVFFDGEVERFKTCAFSSNGKKLITNDGSHTLKLWDVVKRRLVAVLFAGAPVKYCAFSNTGPFIVGGTTDNIFCVWNSITLQRVDRRTIKRSEEDGIVRSEICNRCFRQGCKDTIFSEKLIESVASMRMNRRFLYVMSSLLDIRTSVRTGIYKGVDCIFDLDSLDYLRVIENIHFTMLAAWEINIRIDRFNVENVSSGVNIEAIGNDRWLYDDEEKLIVYSSVLTKEDHSSMSLLTCVLWCSFSPDGTRLATCTSDGFINLWKVDTCQVYQRFRSNSKTSWAACWWSDEYLFVCFVIDTIPCLSRYPVDVTLRINVTDRQLVPLWSVLHEFLPFSKLLEFSEGYLCFECGETEPVKVIDVTEVGQPKKVVLPEMAPMMRIAVSPQGSFVLGARIDRYLLWRKSATQPHVYKVFVRFDEPSYTKYVSSETRVSCRFSNDSKFALVFDVKEDIAVIDMATGIAKFFNAKEDLFCSNGNIFCTATFVIWLERGVVRIFDLQSLNLLLSSYQRSIKEVVFDARLSPKGTVLAVPTLTCDMNFFYLHIPKLMSLLNARKLRKAGRC